MTADLGLAVPPLDRDMGSIEHHLVGEAWRLAPVAEVGQGRIVAIKAPPVFKLRHGRWRGATWLQQERELLWLMGAAVREEGSAGDPYVHFVRLHERGRLLPSADDELRLRAEWAVRFLSEVRAALSEALGEARGRPGTDHGFIAARVSLRLHIRRDERWEEVWLAVRTVDVDGAGVKEEVRSMVFALLEELVGEAEWEAQASWPTGPLHGSEVVRWGLAAADDT